MENIYHTIRGRTKSPRTLESISKDPLSAAKPSYHLASNSLALFSLSLSHYYIYANGLNNTNIIDLTTSGVTNAQDIVPGDVNDDHNKFGKIEDLFGI